MMTDDDSQPVEGEVMGPEGDGQWLPLTVAQPILNVPQKTLYRRAERGQIPSRKNAEGRIEVWVPNARPQDQRLSPIVGLNTADVRELLAPLAQELADSRRESIATAERAARAEALLEAERTKNAALEARLSLGEPARTADPLSLWGALKLWWKGDSH